MEEDISIAPISSHRYFRAPEYIYDGAREYMIEAFGQPKNGTREPFPRYASLRTPKDTDGLAYIALLNRECEWEEVRELLQDLLDAEMVEEIDEETYTQIVNNFSESA